jgi:hypothetical protein
MCKHFVHIHFHLGVHGSEPAMKDHSMVVCCTVRYWDNLDIDEVRHFVTKITCTPFSADGQIQKDFTLLFYAMLAIKIS